MSEEISRDDILNRVERKAAAYEYEYRGCGQNALLALQQEFHLPGGAIAIKTAGFMGGGIARKGNVCGALIGTMIALGLASGRENIEDTTYGTETDTNGQPKRLELARAFYDRFEKEFGSTICKDIQTSRLGRYYDLHNLQDREAFEKIDAHRNCAKVVGKAARLAAEIILDMSAEGLLR